MLPRLSLVLTPPLEGKEGGLSGTPLSGQPTPGVEYLAGHFLPAPRGRLLRDRERRPGVRAASEQGRSPGWKVRAPRLTCAGGPAGKPGGRRPAGRAGGPCDGGGAPPAGSGGRPWRSRRSARPVASAARRIQARSAQAEREKPRSEAGRRAGCLAGREPRWRLPEPGRGTSRSRSRNRSSRRAVAPKASSPPCPPTPQPRRRAGAATGSAAPAGGCCPPGAERSAGGKKEGRKEGTEEGLPGRRHPSPRRPAPSGAPPAAQPEPEPSLRGLSRTAWPGRLLDGARRQRSERRRRAASKAPGQMSPRRGARPPGLQ